MRVENITDEIHNHLAISSIDCACNTHDENISKRSADKKKLSHPRYAYNNERLSSFQQCPLLRESNHIPDTLSEAGFFYSEDRNGTVCYQCDLGLKDWEEDDNPYIEHAWWMEKNCQQLKDNTEPGFIQAIKKYKDAGHSHNLLTIYNKTKIDTSAIVFKKVLTTEDIIFLHNTLSKLNEYELNCTNKELDDMVKNLNYNDNITSIISSIIDNR